MSEIKPTKPLESSLASRDDAAATLGSFRSFLKSPAFESNVDLVVLTKLAADEAVPVRERRLAAEVLMRYRMKAMETLASLEGVREQILKDLGIDASTKTVSMTQVNTRIEIVRKSDWRDLEDGVVAPDNEAPIVDVDATVVEPSDGDAS